ncbi:hypothetical protein C8Q77DRAFT_843927 [Trametes polyzona]|nr:hypothetical protein C8Q77DRAFT_843927 [Trametes polyzona]
MSTGFRRLHVLVLGPGLSSSVGWRHAARCNPYQIEHARTITECYCAAFLGALAIDLNILRSPASYARTPAESLRNWHIILRRDTRSPSATMDDFFVIADPIFDPSDAGTQPETYGPDTSCPNDFERHGAGQTSFFCIIA